jgi:hypothetical protein
MLYKRFWRFEVYRTPGWHFDINPDNSCGCRLFCGFGIGVTFLSKECYSTL